MVKRTVVDPPGGWAYGFPDWLEEDYEEQLKKKGYPVKDIPLALKYSRYWEEEDDE